MLVSSISPLHSTFPNLDVQPTISSDVQPVHPDDAHVPTSLLTVTATSSYTFGTGSVHTLLTNSALPGHSIATVNFTGIYGSPIPTTSQHSNLTYWLYQGIWL